MLGKEEKQRRKFFHQELKKRNLALFMKEFGVANRAWLRELTEKYKGRGVFPLSPIILSDYYKDYGDKLLATLIACLLLNNNSKVMEQVLSMKKILGEHPYEDLYSNRTFVQLSNGDDQTKHASYFGSVQYWKIAKLMDIVWNIEHMHGKPLFGIFFELITVSGYTPYYALFSLFEDLPISAPEWRINLALLRLCSNDGIGEHLWDLGGLESKLECPFNKQVRLFMENWFPKWSYVFTFSEICTILGFKKETDVFYCMLGFKELALSKPKEIQDYLHTYIIQLRHRSNNKYARRWIKERTPKIAFDE